MKPYVEQGGIRVFLGDVREVLPALAASEALDVSCVLADPPYGVTSLAWDKWPTGWPDAVARHVPENASLWCFGSMRMFLSSTDDFRAWRYSQDVVWEKQNGSGFDAERFRRVHEHAVMFYRGLWGEVFTKPQQTFGHAPMKKFRSPGKPAAHMGDIRHSTYESSGERLMTTVIRVPSVHGDADVFNETQKPIGIVEPLVRYSLRPGSVLLDPFCGSGTALVVAKQLGARAIGIDCREDQCEASAKRLVQTMALGGAA